MVFEQEDLEAVVELDDLGRGNLELAQLGVLDVAIVVDLRKRSAGQSDEKAEEEKNRNVPSNHELPSSSLSVSV